MKKKHLFLAIPLIFALTGCNVIRRLVPSKSKEDSELSSEQIYDSETTSTTSIITESITSEEEPSENTSEELSEDSSEVESSEEIISEDENSEEELSESEIPSESSSEEIEDSSSYEEESSEEESSDYDFSSISEESSEEEPSYSEESEPEVSSYVEESSSEEEQSSGTSEQTTSESGYYTGYYSSISKSLTGDSLRSALNTLNNSKRKKVVGYGGMKSFAAKCDIDPDGSGKIIGFYDNAKIGPSWDSGSTWNREHVWPNARGGGSVEDDAHMPRPASTKTNSNRGSKGFGTASYDPGEFVEYYRGVSSRIIFYCMIANMNLKLSSDPFNHDYNSKIDPANTMGCLEDMLRWNLQYLPSDTSFSGDDDLARRVELNRNEIIEKDSSGQGNRNPFIDHPEFACKIWGNTNSTTRSICGV